MHLVMLACKAGLSSTASNNMLSTTMLGKSFVSSSMRQLSSSTVRLGGAEGEAEEANLEGEQPTFACQVDLTKR